MSAKEKLGYRILMFIAGKLIGETEEFARLKQTLYIID